LHLQLLHRSILVINSVSAQTPVTAQTLPKLFSELEQPKEHVKLSFHIQFPNSMAQVKRNHLCVYFASSNLHSINTINIV